MTLRGDPELCYGSLALSSALRSLQQGGEGFLVQLWPVETVEDGDSHVPEELRKVLAENQQVFQVLLGLPAHCHYDHSITLKEGAIIPNLRPYRYPHYQKNAIEALVQEMLDSGIIRPSVNPFASPITLSRRRMEARDFVSITMI